MFDSYWVIPDEVSDISHYGVKGMKWGVRKSEYRSMSRKDRKQLRKNYKTDRKRRVNEFVTNNSDKYRNRKEMLSAQGKAVASVFLLSNALAFVTANSHPGMAKTIALLGNSFAAGGLLGMPISQITYDRDVDKEMAKNHK